MTFAALMFLLGGCLGLVAERAYNDFLILFFRWWDER
jgi:hypothetical protein